MKWQFAKGFDMTPAKSPTSPKKDKAQAKVPAAKKSASRAELRAKRRGETPRTRNQVRTNYRKNFSYFLGQAEDINELAMVQKIHERLPTTVVEKFLDIGIMWPELEIMLIPRRTFTHRLTNNEPLTVVESDRAVRMARVLALAESVFDNKERAMRWLRKEMKRFNGNTPIQMMDTDTGSRMVEEALTQIDEGFFA